MDSIFIISVFENILVDPDIQNNGNILKYSKPVGLRKKWIAFSLSAPSKTYESTPNNKIMEIFKEFETYQFYQKMNSIFKISALDNLLIDSNIKLKRNI